MRTVILSLSCMAVALGQAPPTDISEGHDVTAAPARQEFGITTAIRVGDRTTRAATGYVGLQWAFLITTTRQLTVQYVLEGRPFVQVAHSGQPSTNGWSVSPAGVRTILRNHFYLDTAGGLLRTRITPAEQTSGVSQYYRTWEIGSGVQLGRASRINARIGYKYLRAWNSSIAAYDFTAHMISAGVFFPARR